MEEGEELEEDKGMEGEQEEGAGKGKRKDEAEGGGDRRTERGGPQKQQEGEEEENGKEGEPGEGGERGEQRGGPRSGKGFRCSGRSWELLENCRSLLGPAGGLEAITSRSSRGRLMGPSWAYLGPSRASWGLAPLGASGW